METTLTIQMPTRLPLARRRDDEPCEALLLQACRPAALGRDVAAALAGLAVAHPVRLGEVVLSRAEPARSIWLVGQGSVALGTRGDAGLLQHRCSVHEGEWLDVASALLGGDHAEDAVAETDGVVWQLPLQAVLRLGQSEPSVLQALALALAAQVGTLVEGTRGLMTKDVRARCATWLLEQAELDAGGADDLCTPTLQLRQRKRAVALQLGTTAETFSRTLRQLNKAGLIDVKGYAITLCDVAGLRRVAEPASAG